MGAALGTNFRTKLRTKLLSITTPDALHRRRAVLLSRAADLYRSPLPEQDAPPALRVQYHALAWRHLHVEAARDAAHDAFTELSQPATADPMSARLRTHVDACAAGIDAAREHVEQLADALVRIEGCMQASEAGAGLHACEALLPAYEACGNPRYLRQVEDTCRAIASHHLGGPTPAIRLRWAWLMLRLACHPVALAGTAGWLLPAAEELAGAALADIGDAAGLALLADALVVASLLAALSEDRRHAAAAERAWQACWNACLRIEPADTQAVAELFLAVERMTLQA
jgi:hypothetical protein